MPKTFRATAVALLVPFAVQAGPILLFPPPAMPPFSLQGGEHTIRECAEASEFILHAAQARDNGQSGTKFKQRLEDDLELVRRYPPHLRWFVQNQQHEAFLRAMVAEVFGTKREAEELQQETLLRCQGVRNPRGMMNRQYGNPNPF